MKNAGHAKRFATLWRLENAVRPGCRVFMGGGAVGFGSVDQGKHMKGIGTCGSSQGVNRRQAIAGAIGGLTAGLGAARWERRVSRAADHVTMPEDVRAIYMNTSIVHDAADIQRLIGIIERTELNAIVVDIKEIDIFYRSRVSFFRELGVVTPLVDVSDLISAMHDRNIWTIARLVVFKDPLVAEKRPDLAVRHKETGGVWRDDSGIAWVNPFAEELWDANARLAREAARLGFDEIQFDYVRFPTDGDLAMMDFGRQLSAKSRTAAIADFLKLAREELEPLEASMSADVFGYTLMVDDDLGIGQDFRVLTPLVDSISPMVYPSHFPEGSIDVPGHPNDYPFEVIQLSLTEGKKKLPELAHRIRPWLQDFSLPGMNAYGRDQVRAQIDATESVEVGGWMIWNAASVFTEAAFNSA